jgi:hypothetical protein
MASVQTFKRDISEIDPFEVLLDNSVAADVIVRGNWEKLRSLFPEEVFGICFSTLTHIIDVGKGTEKFDQYVNLVYKFLLDHNRYNDDVVIVDLNETAFSELVCILRENPESIVDVKDATPLAIVKSLNEYEENFKHLIFCVSNMNKYSGLYPLDLIYDYQLGD